MQSKQLSLKPQDFVLALKLAVNGERHFTFAQLAMELSLSASEAHAAFSRAEQSRLATRQGGEPRAIKSSLQEFTVHGMPYAFPPTIGAHVRGMLTGIGAPPLAQHFGQSKESAHVWPDHQGSDRGPSILPFYPTVPAAARKDPLLYEVLACVDAIRAGAAREREIATKEILMRL